MLSVNLAPHWRITGPGGLTLPPRVMDWLEAIQQHGSLAAAATAQGVSYRHAWNLLREAEAALGGPLLTMRRGRGARLTPLGERLVWAQRRVSARLGPQLDSLASELQAELHRLLANAPRPLRVWASHGFAIEALQHLWTQASQAIDWRYTDSSQALAALHAGNADIASLHLPLASNEAGHAIERAMLAHHARWLAPDWCYVHMVTRRQGLMVRPGNPLQLDGIADLLRPDVRFVPRTAGSGTRLLLETLLRQAGCDPTPLGDGQAGEHTHSAVAAYVASGMADVAFGVEASARRFGLEFIPVQTERYGLVLRASEVDSPTVQPLIGLLRSPACAQAFADLPGYRADQSGEITPAAQVFEGWPRG